MPYIYFLPLVVAVLALIGTFAFFCAMNLVAEIDARGEDAAKFDSVRFHTHYSDRLFINVKISSVIHTLCQVHMSTQADCDRYQCAKMVEQLWHGCCKHSDKLARLLQQTLPCKKLVKHIDAAYYAHDVNRLNQLQGNLCHCKIHDCLCYLLQIQEGKVRGHTFRCS